MSSDQPTLTIVVCAYNMARELPRTLKTLSRSYQKDTDHLSWELIVVDNGSSEPLDEARLSAIVPGLRINRIENATSSPAAALNSAINQSSGQLIGIWIDGARMASPGIIANAVDAWQADRTKVISTLAFHLGHDVQDRSVLESYNAEVEDALLASVPWEKDGYKLFDISVLARSSGNGWFSCLSETNGLFLDRTLWNSLAGFDTRFTSPGGGYVNLEFWARAVEISGNRPWMLLGEGTFHQVHGGAATNGTQEARNAMRQEYERLCGKPFAAPRYQPLFVGSLDQRLFQAGMPK